MANTINDSKRYIAYICPFCSEINRQNINIFQLSAISPLEFLCQSEACLEECFSISRIKDKFKITVECPACGDVHTFKISTQSFLFKDLITFSCPECNINIFFAGKKDKVEKSVTENCDKISQISEQFDFFTEEINIMYKIIDKLHLLIGKHKISCSCGSVEIFPDVSNGVIALTCCECGKNVFIQPDELSLEFLENSDGFTI